MSLDQIRDKVDEICAKKKGRKLFALRENKTNVLRELMAGLTTFMAMSYILLVNPNLLAGTGMPREELFTAIALASAIGTLTMGLFANLPYGLAPGIGLSVFFVSLCAKMGYSWKFVLLCVFAEGLILLILSLLNVREALLRALPENLRKGISAGIGFFLILVGLQSAGLITVDAGYGMVMGRLDNIPAILTLAGFLIITVLYHYNVRAAMFLGIVATWLLGIGCQLLGWYTVGEGAPSLIPAKLFSLPVWVKSLGGACFDFKSILGDFPNVWIFLLNAFCVILALLYSDFFGTLGTMLGVAKKGALTESDGTPVRAKQAFFANAVSTMAGGVLGTSTATVYAESAAGVMQGGRTGLASVMIAVMFLLSLFFAPLFLAVPGFAVAPILIFVGILMTEPIFTLPFEDLSETIPAVLAALVMPFSGSIANGIAAGVVFYTLIHVLEFKFKKLNVCLYVLTVLFIAYFVLIA